MSVIDYTQRCAVCPGSHRCIQPDGPRTRGGILFVGEAPGVTEERRDRPFVGKTGQEVDEHYLPLAGLKRSEVTFHNAISCLPDTPGGKLDPKQPKHQELLEVCASTNLYPLIDEMQPSLIVPMGNFSCRAIYGPGFDLEVRHGIPCDSEFGPTFPMYHPALGLHEPKKMLYVRTDWDRLRKYLRGTLVVPRDEYAGQEDYQEVTNVRDLVELDPTGPIACDTESSPRLGPFCLTYSQQPGTGRLIRAERVDLLGDFQARISQWESPILFHNWLYDWSVIDAMGLLLPYSHLVDTMAVVYQLGNLPQGLKALAIRELGMAMMDFEDVVLPHSRKRCLEYYELASFEDWPKPEPQIVLGADGRWKTYQAQSMKAKLKRFFTDYRKNPEGKDVFGAWNAWEDSHAQIEAILGPWPGKDIAHVPFEEALFYACRDSDALGRLWPIIKRMRTFVRRFGQESWRERAA